MSQKSAKKLRKLIGLSTLEGKTFKQSLNSEQKSLYKTLKLNYSALDSNSRASVTQGVESLIKLSDNLSSNN